MPSSPSSTRCSSSRSSASIRSASLSSWRNSPAAAGLARARTYREWRKLTDIIDELGVHQYCNPTLAGLGEPQQLLAACVTASWFGVHRVQTMLVVGQVSNRKMAVSGRSGNREAGRSIPMCCRTSTLANRSATPLTTAHRSRLENAWGITSASKDSTRTLR